MTLLMAWAISGGIGICGKVGICALATVVNSAADVIVSNRRIVLEMLDRRLVIINDYLSHVRCFLSTVQSPKSYLI